MNALELLQCATHSLLAPILLEDFLAVLAHLVTLETELDPMDAWQFALQPVKMEEFALNQTSVNVQMDTVEILANLMEQVMELLFCSLSPL